MKLFIAAVAGFALTVAFACSTPAVLEPKTGPGTQYPCGVHGIVCADAYCCDEGEACMPPTPTIPTAMCETVYDDARRLGARKAHPAWKPKAR